MRFGFRKPSFKKSFAARTSPTRIIKTKLGLRAPKGLGIITNPKKAIYNKLYNTTTFSVDDHKRTKHSQWFFFLILILGVLFLFGFY